MMCRDPKLMPKCSLTSITNILKHLQIQNRAFPFVIQAQYKAESERSLIEKHKFVLRL